MDNKRLVLGPSHVARWVQSVECGVVPELENTDFHGKGGASIWGDFIKKKHKNFDQYDEIIFIVGDFRFGNRSLGDDSILRNQHGIGKEFISDHNDMIMYKKVIDELNKLVNSSFSFKIKLIFWDLALREFKNIKDKKYTSSGVYLHPIWNLDKIQTMFSDNTLKIDLSLDLGLLSIDGSNHPSYLGYVYLYSLILGKRFVPSSIDFFPSFRLNSRKIIGDSRIIKEINSFCEKGILKKDYSLSEVRLSDIEKYLNTNAGSFLFFSNLRQINGNENAFSEKIKKIFDFKRKFGNRLEVVFWEGFGQEVISTRNRGYSKFLPENPLYEHDTIARVFGNEHFYPKKTSISAQSLFELNTGLQPTMKGILWLFMCSDHSLNEFEEYYYKFKGDCFSLYLNSDNKCVDTISQKRSQT